MHPQLPEILATLSQQLQEGLWPEACATVKTQIAVIPGDASELRDYFRMQIQQLPLEDWLQAELDVAKANGMPQDFHDYLQSAWMQREGRFTEAKRLALNCVNDHEASNWNAIMLLRIASDQGVWPSTDSYLEDLEAFHASQPADAFPEIPYLRAKRLVRKGEYRKALALLAATPETMFTSLDRRILQMEALYRLGDVAGSQEILNKIPDNLRTLPDVIQWAYWISTHSGESLMQIAKVSRAAERYPEHAGIATARAHFCWESGFEPVAARYMDTAWKVGQWNAETVGISFWYDATQGRAIDWARWGESARTERYYSLGFYLANAALAAGREISEAIALATLSTGFLPDWLAAWILLGDCHLLALDFEAATAAYTQALDICPTSHEAISGLGRAAEAAMDWDAAIDHYRRSVVIEPRQPEVLYRLGKLYDEAKDDPATAAQWLGLLVELDGLDRRNPRNLEAYANVLARLGHAGKAAYYAALAMGGKREA